MKPSEIGKIESDLIEKNKKKKNKDEPKPIFTSLINESGIFAEQLYKKGNGVKYAVLRDGEVEIENEIEVNGIEHKPIFDEEVHKDAVLLPSEATEYGSDEELNSEIKNFINYWLDIPKNVLQFALF